GAPAFPLPCSRIRCPSRVPALIRTSRGSVLVTTPSPRQLGQLERFFPVPWQRGHCTLNFIRPPVCVICPLPPHSGHFPGDSMAPSPWHCGQTSWRVIFNRITPP